MSLKKHLDYAEALPEPEKIPRHLRIWAVAKATVLGFMNDKVSQHGAALSFFSVFALPPLLVLIVMFLGWILGDNARVQAQILGQVRRAGGGTSVEVVKTIMENATHPDGLSFAALISIGVLIFSATNVFAQIQDSLNTIWGVKIRPEVSIKVMLIGRIWSFGLILSLGGLVIVLLFVDLIIALLQNTLGSQLGILDTLQFYKFASLGISFVLLTLILAIVFKVLPDVLMRWRDVWVGSFFTAVLLSLSKYLIGFYLSSSNLGSAYGAAGSTIIFLFWLYLNIQIFFLGAEFTESYAREFGASVQPNKYAIWLPGHEVDMPSERT